MEEPAVEYLTWPMAISPGSLSSFDSLKTSDMEVVLHLIAISKARPFFLRIVEACGKLEGAYSMFFLTKDKLVAVRDPFGFHPLVMGRRSNDAVVFASETCALDLIEATYEREVYPGEVIVVDKEGVQSVCLMPHFEPKSCIFEHIYFALPNSVVFGRSVYESRRAFGEILAMESPVDCDVVIAVPDSGVVAALEKSGDGRDGIHALFGRNLTRSSPIPVNLPKNYCRSRI